MTIRRPRSETGAVLLRHRRRGRQFKRPSSRCQTAPRQRCSRV